MNNFIQIIAMLRSHLGVSISTFMHLGLFILLLINFPQCSTNPPLERIISVDLLPISQVSNVENKKLVQEKKKEPEPEKPKPIQKEVEPEPENKPEDLPKPAPIADPVDNPLPKVEEKKKEPVVEKKKEEKKIDKKPETKNKPTVQPKKDIKKKKPTKPKISEYDKLLKDLQKIEQTNDMREEVADKPNKGHHNADMPLSLSIKDSIRRQVEKYWNPPAGNKDASRLQILLKISLKQDGSVASVKVIDNMRYAGDESYRVAADAAVRAVYKASPLEGLPENQYSTWQDLEFNFNPTDILGD